jgi:hypothetical protein
VDLVRGRWLCAIGHPLEPLTFQACATRPHILVGVLYFRPPTMDPDNFEGGFVAAIQALQDPSTSPVGALGCPRVICFCGTHCGGHTTPVIAGISGSGVNSFCEHGFAPSGSETPCRSSCIFACRSPCVC